MPGTMHLWVCRRDGNFCKVDGWAEHLPLFARLRAASRRYGAASFAGEELAWFTEPKLAAGERRMVDQTGIEPVTS